MEKSLCSQISQLGVARLLEEADHSHPIVQDLMRHLTEGGCDTCTGALHHYHENLLVAQNVL